MDIDPFTKSGQMEILQRIQELGELIKECNREQEIAAAKFMATASRQLRAIEECAAIANSIKGAVTSGSATRIEHQQQALAPHEMN